MFSQKKRIFKTQTVPKEVVREVPKEVVREVPQEDPKVVLKKR